MAQSQHASYNRLLNSLVSRSGEASYTGAKISYLRRKEVDYFHPTSTGRVRVTRDADTLAIKPNGVIQKQRLADLNIYCPHRRFDYRISINVENTGKFGFAMASRRKLTQQQPRNQRPTTCPYVRRTGSRTRTRTLSSTSPRSSSPKR